MHRSCPSKVSGLDIRYGGAGMTRRFGIATGIVGALVTTGTLVLSLAVWGSSAAVASGGTGTPGTAHVCHPGPFADCAGADLAGANLSYRNLSNADLAYADLSGADLGSANLTGANLRGADLGDADMMKANLKRADLSGGNFMGADLSGAMNSNLDSASATSTQYVVCHTILPSGRRPVQDC
jgi:Pentapeptide repeats (8 copies)